MVWARLVIYVVLGCTTTNAVASPKPQTASSEVLSAVAKDRFAAKDFVTAADLYLQAYAKSNNPNTLFNAARSYEEAGNKTAALSTYQLYVKLSTSADGIIDAQEHIAKLNGVTKPANAAPQPAISQPTPVAPKPGINTAAWLTTGGSAVTIGGGVILMFVGSAGTKSSLVANDHAGWDSARQQWIGGVILTGTGVVLAGISTYLWVSNGPVKVVPTGNGLAFAGEF